MLEASGKERTGLQQVEMLDGAGREHEDDYPEIS